jgi:hypothetical protein
MDDENADVERSINRLVNAFSRMGMVVEGKHIAMMSHWIKSCGLMEDVSPSLFEANGRQSVLFKILWENF